MQETSPIMGYIMYLEKEYPFLFEEGILRLFPPTRQEWRERRGSLFKDFEKFKTLHQKQEWIGHSLLKGRTQDGFCIVFCVSNSSSNDNGFESFSVDYYFKYNGDFLDEETIYGFSVTGREVDYFYNPRRAFAMDSMCDESGNSRTGVYARQTKSDTAGSYWYKNTEITVSFHAIPTIHFRSETPLSARSRMIFSFSRPQNLRFLIDVYEHCLRFFYYVCYRVNVKLAALNVYGMREGQISCEGVVAFYGKEHTEEPDLEKAREIITYDDLEGKMVELFPPLAQNQIYLEHLCSSVAARSSWGINRIILMFVAFEREFRNLYDDTVTRSEAYVEVREEVLKYLKNRKEQYTGKKKKYVGEIERTLSKTENKYADRMEKAMRDCEEILRPFLKYYYRDYQSDMIGDICDRMNQLRNDSAHGNIDLRIDPVHISDFAILESLVYAMRLKAIGVETRKIQVCLQTLKGNRRICTE